MNGLPRGLEAVSLGPFLERKGDLLTSFLLYSLDQFRFSRPASSFLTYIKGELSSCLFSRKRKKDRNPGPRFPVLRFRSPLFFLLSLSFNFFLLFCTVEVIRRGGRCRVLR